MTKVDSELPSCFAASLNPRLDKKEGGKMGTASLIRYQNISRTIFGFICSPPSRISQLFFLSHRILHTIFYPFHMSFLKDKINHIWIITIIIILHCPPSSPPLGFPEYSEASRGLLDVPSSSQCSERKWREMELKSFLQKWYKKSYIFLPLVNSGIVLNWNMLSLETKTIFGIPVTTGQILIPSQQNLLVLKM